MRCNNQCPYLPFFLRSLSFSLCRIWLMSLEDKCAKKNSKENRFHLQERVVKRCGIQAGSQKLLVLHCKSQMLPGIEQRERKKNNSCISTLPYLEQEKKRLNCPLIFMELPNEMCCTKEASFFTTRQQKP